MGGTLQLEVTMQVIHHTSGLVEVKMNEEEARKLLFVAQEVKDIYLELREDSSEDPEVAGHAGLGADMLENLQIEMEGAGLVD